MGSLVYDILQEGISEVIATTRYNAAPMGIIRKGEDFSLIIFKTSHTAENISRENRVVAHIVQDPELFVRAAFDDLSPDVFVEDTAGDMEICRLKGVDNWIAFTACIKHETPEKVFVRLEPVHAEFSPVLPFPVRRGMNNLIEAAVHGTRYIISRDPALAELIRHHGDLVMRCGSQSEKGSLRLLYQYLNQVSPDPGFKITRH
ncbi:MAG: DUF447 family protein [Methanospirillum sp.]|nr:DUF447 family protein [Methanospirillum sp.]